MKNTLLLLFAIIAMQLSTKAAEPKLILVEQMTTSSNALDYLRPIAAQFNQIVNSNVEVIPLTYHINENPDLFWEQRKDLSNRILYYKKDNEQYPLPSFYVNGSEQVGISGLQNKINTQKNKVVPIKMKVQIDKTNDAFVFADVKIDLDTVLKSSDVLFCAIIERKIVAPQVGNTNEPEYYYVTRQIGLQPKGGAKITRNDLGFSGNRFNFQKENFWNMDEMYVIAWIQNDDSKQILQAEKEKVYNEKPMIANNKDSIIINDDNKSVTQFVEIYNSSMADLTIASVELDNTTDFTLQHNVSETKITPGMTKIISVKLKNTDLGTFNGNLIVKSNANNKSELIIPITALIETNSNPILTTETSILNFGKVSKSKIETVAITNTGTGKLVISSIEFSENEGGEFSIVNNSFPEISENSTLFIEVNFTPTDEEIYFSTMKITSNATNSPSLSIPVSGEGESLIEFASILVNTEAINFDKTNFTTPLIRSLVIKNTGNQTLQVKNSGIEKNIGAAFKLVGEKNLSIPPKGTDSLSVEFLPSENKAYTATLVVRSNDIDPAKTRIEISLSGTGEGTTSVENLVDGMAVSFVNQTFVIDLNNQSISHIHAEFYNLNGTLLIEKSLQVNSGRNTINTSAIGNNQVVFFKLTSEGKIIGTGKFINN